ncbi:unnamed protein product [Nezara viridula]|uniref:Uncharacterized protein n=1 Tax=Nezara viridula TaxID=85310 RepID=A0A9P0H132_NEZVI|nr:unnamed protein product [Nezara viridula]
MAAKETPFKSFGIAWEEPSRSNNIYYYLNPIFINSRVLGCFPFDSKMATSYVRIIVTALLMCIMASTGAIYAYSSFGIPYSTTANAIVYMSIVVLAIFSTLLVVFFTILQQKTLITALDRIRAIDAKLLTIGVIVQVR